MPTYEYTCKSCHQHLEAVQRFTDDPLTECPACGGDLRKVYGQIGISFKGSGFYKTDSRSGRNGRSPSSASEHGGSDEGSSSREQKESSDAGSSSKDSASSSKDGGSSAESNGSKDSASASKDSGSAKDSGSGAKDSGAKDSGSGSKDSSSGSKDSGSGAKAESGSKAG